MGKYEYITLNAEYSDEEKELNKQLASIKENMEITQKKYAEVKKKLKKENTEKLKNQLKELEKAYGFHIMRYNKINEELYK